MKQIESDLETLQAMRERAQTLAIARDPLFAGAVAQLVGIIDGLIRITIPPDEESRETGVRSRGRLSGGESP